MFFTDLCTSGDVFGRWAAWLTFPPRWRSHMGNFSDRGLPDYGTFLPTWRNHIGNFSDRGLPDYGAFLPDGGVT
jgi:hypothetical protein